MEQNLWADAFQEIYLNADQFPDLAQLRQQIQHQYCDRKMTALK
jgi:hypothetical protein